jgi:predicted permease
LFYEQLLDRIETFDGVESVALASRAPLASDRSQGRFHIENRPNPVNEEAGFTGGFVTAGTGLFWTLEIPLIRGRLLDERDRPGTLPTVVIDEEMARRYWPDEDPIGKRIRFGRTDGPFHTIVGVVGNARFDGVALRSPTYYDAYAQEVELMDFHVRAASVIVRASGDPMNLAGPVREAVRGLDPDLPIVYMRTMDQFAAAAVARPRFLMTLLGVFAAAALTLGAIGIYGVIAHAVARRTGEIGIRMALGAQGGEVVRMVVGQGMAVVILGVVGGVSGALLLTRVMEGLLYELSPTDPSTFVLVALAVTAIGLLACYLPARRASRVEPTTALRRG